MLALAFINQWPPDWQRAVEQVFASLQAQVGRELPSGTIHLKLVNDAEIAALNQQSTGQNYATDVLTFNYQEGADDTYGELADIV
ncbi:MAG TPA: rRNA maturation RNAse YbeY, partial [Candidatus Saccharimonadia bacterium]